MSGDPFLDALSNEATEGGGKKKGGKKKAEPEAPPPDDDTATDDDAAEDEEPAPEKAPAGKERKVRSKKTSKAKAAAAKVTGKTKGAGQAKVGKGKKGKAAKAGGGAVRGAARKLGDADRVVRTDAEPPREGTTRRVIYDNVPNGEKGIAVATLVEKSLGNKKGLSPRGGNATEAKVRRRILIMVKRGWVRIERAAA